jgi:serine protease Do
MPVPIKTKIKLSRKASAFILLVFVILTSFLGGALGDRLLGYKVLDRWFPPRQSFPAGQVIEQKVVKEESMVIDVVEKVSDSVVTVGVKKTKAVVNPFENFFDPFDFFGLPQQLQPETPKEEPIEQDIGSGFVISADGLIVTNKHVVSDLEAEYKIITKDNQEYKVEKIFRDPAMDMAILQITATGLKPVELGNSADLKVGQSVIAIGTALGEFRNTVTTGVISGLGRGISAGDIFGSQSEQLENVIQTDAAINPGNSGGPLLNSLGQVIGVNVATTSGAENIGFAIPINLVKEALENFNQTGKFERPYLGVKYKMITKDLALLNEVPEGAYVVEVIEESPAAKAGVKQADIIVKIDGRKIQESKGGLAKMVQEKKIGEEVELEIWREKETFKLKVTLESGE